MELCQCKQLQYLDLSFNFFELDINLKQKSDTDTLNNSGGSVVESLPNRPIGNNHGIPYKYDNTHDSRRNKGCDSQHIWYFGPYFQNLMDQFQRELLQLTYMNLSGNCFKTNLFNNASTRTIPHEENCEEEKEAAATGELKDEEVGVEVELDEGVLSVVNKDLCCFSRQALLRNFSTHQAQLK